ncbi:hypothetical protein PVK06_002166 [Gossypium arboreum]|uniref:Uncharacterized protein n=1 Tax=Gossypium arboreum TaxID=29729 RepID=A0ABR0R2X8_GOSAR|nr:hypothetical protein PVK06_002166 [Gossypium arboreum]
MWDDYDGYGRLGYDPLYDSYSYACLVDSDNQRWEGGHTTSDPYDLYSLYSYKDGGVYREEPNEDHYQTTQGRPFDYGISKYQENTEAPYTIVEHEGLKVDFQQEMEVRGLSEELSIIEEMSEPSEENVKELPHFLHIVEEISHHKSTEDVPQ